MKKDRISSNVDPQLAVSVRQAAKALGLTTSKFIEGAVLSELGRVDIFKETQHLIEKLSCTQEVMKRKQAALEERRTENQKLRECRRKLEKQVSDLRTERDQLETEKNQTQEDLERIATALGVPDTAQHCIQRVNEIKESCESKIKMILERSLLGRILNVIPWA